MTESFKHGSKYTKDDFYEFGIRIGISKIRIGKIYERFMNKEKRMNDLINKSFLPDELKEKYSDSVFRRLKRLEYSYGAQKE
jgi:serine/threonine-protein kinase HipA